MRVRARAKLNILLLVLCLLLAFPAQALSEDFLVQGPAGVQLDMCSPAHTTFTVYNTGQISSGYTVSAQSSVPWVRITPAQFSLDPGQARVVTQTFTVPCDESGLGEHSLRTLVESALGLEKTLTQKIVVARPENIDVSAQAYDVSAGVCQDASVPFEVRNPGRFEESYSLFLDSSLGASLSDDVLVLGPGQVRRVSIDVPAQDCVMHGQFPLRVRTQALVSGLEAVTDFTLDISAQDLPVFDLPGQVRIDYTGAQITVPVSLLEGEALFDVTLEGADTSWMSLDASSLSLSAQEPGQVLISLDPLESVNGSEETPEGVYPIELVLRSRQRADLEFAKSLSVQLRRPSLVEKLFTKYLPLTLISLLVLLALVGFGAYAIYSYLEYTKTPEYQKELERKKKEAQLARKRREEELAKKAKEREERAKEKERLKLEKRKEKEKKAQEKLALRKKQEEEKLKKKLARQVEKKLKSEYRLVPHQEVRGRKLVWFARIILVLILVLIIAAASLLVAFWSTIVSLWPYALLGVSLALLLVLLHALYMKMRSRKIRKGLLLHLPPGGETIFSTGWKRGLGELGLTVKKAVKDVRIVVERFTRLPAYVVPKREVFEYFAFKAENLDNDDLREARMRFKVPKAWLDKRSVDKDSVKAVRYLSDGWQAVPTAIIGEDDKYVAYQAKFSKKGLFAIAGVQVKREEKRSTSLMPKGPMSWLLVLLTVLFLVGLGYYLLGMQQAIPSPVSTGNGIPDQVWAQDSQHRLNLSRYVSDPDGDALSFSHSGTEHIFIAIEDGLVTFTPEKGWFGAETVVFTADDARGGSAQSNEVRLEVVEVTSFVPKSLRDNLLYILLGIGVLIIIMVIVQFRGPIVSFLEEED